MDIDNDLNSDKYMARVAMAQAGLCPKNESGQFDFTGFEDFWSRYMTTLAGQRTYQVYEIWTELQKAREECRRRRDKNADDRKPLAFFALGILLGALLTLYLFRP